MTKNSPVSVETSDETIALPAKTYHELIAKLEDAVATLEAIRTGQVDAVVVEGEHGPKVYTLEGADHPYRIYVEKMQEGAVSIDSDGLMLYANRQFANLVGRPLSDVIGAALPNFLSKTTWRQLSHVFKKGDDPVKCDTVLRGSGKQRHVQITASLLSQEESPIACLVVTDLTNQKERSRLQLAKEVAERDNASKDAFIAALSHELRTPLTPALIAASLLASDSSLSPEAQRQVATVRRNVELEARLIDDLLDLTRIAKGKLEFRTEPVDVHHAIELALETCRSEIAQKGHYLELDLQASSIHIEGDPVRLQQVFWNLIRNAAKFSRSNGSIKISTRNTSEDRIKVSITDRGIGIAKARLEQIFGAFEQGGKRVTNQFGGLGLGLAISRAIVDAHHGKIAATSPGTNKGATFTIELPLAEGVCQTRASEPADHDSSSAAASNRILLVEDNADSRVALQMLLRSLGHTVTAVEMGREAVALAKEKEFDLLICDIGLPDISGLQVNQAIQETCSLRSIAISGYGMEADLAKSELSGFEAHLTKPVDPAKLIDAIRTPASVS